MPRLITAHNDDHERFTFEVDGKKAVGTKLYGKFDGDTAIIKRVEQFDDVNSDAKNTVYSDTMMALVDWMKGFPDIKDVRFKEYDGEVEL